MTGAEIRSNRCRREKSKADFEGAVTKNLQNALKDSMDLSNADYDTLEDIADGLEKMLHSWNDVQEQRAMEYARLKASLAKDKSQCHKGTADMKETLEDIGVRVAQDSTEDDTLLKSGSPESQWGHNSPEDAAVRQSSCEGERRMLPEWAALINNEFSDRISTKRKGVLKHLYGVKAMPLKKKPRNQVISVQIQDNKRDKGDCTCEFGDNGDDRKKWPPIKETPLGFIKGKDSTENLKKQIEELQIALLESATEYELKILQIKMQMLQNKNEVSKQNPQAHEQQHQMEDTEGEVHTFDCSRKQVSRLQKDKRDLTKEVFEYRKREKMFEQQRKVLEDAQYRVNCLKRELMKKEGQLVNVQLREKALSVKISQLEDALRSSSNRGDVAKLWHALPELQEWLQSLRKDGPTRLDNSHLHQFQHYEAQISKLLESIPQKTIEEETALPFHRSCQASQQPPPVDKCRKKLFERCTRPKKEAKKEAEALQKELHKLAHPKQLKTFEKAISSTSDSKSTESGHSKKQEPMYHNFMITRQQFRQT